MKNLTAQQRHRAELKKAGGRPVTIEMDALTYAGMCAIADALGKHKRDVIAHLIRREMQQCPAQSLAKFVTSEMVAKHWPPRN